MKSLSSIVLVAAVHLSLFAGCHSEESKAVAPIPQWRSKHFQVSALLTDGWHTASLQTRGDVFDRPDGLLQAFVNPAGPYGYSIHIEPGVPLDDLPLEAYFRTIREHFEMQSSHTLMDEQDVDFHGQKYHCFRFRVAGTKGPAIKEVRIYRDDAHTISVQWTYPAAPKGDTEELPRAISDFDAGVSVRL